jgi:broad specificity phosphatase PhoE
MNYLNNITKLNNHYFILRHGESVANKERIIISSLKDGLTGYGLTDLGEKRVKKEVTELRKSKLLDGKTIIISSDFLRTKETANIAKDILKTGPVILSQKLRERDFGKYDKTNVDDYIKGYGTNKDNITKNIESPEKIEDRVTSAVKELETKYKDKNILIVSHGDVLQILQTIFKKIPLTDFRSLPYIDTGEIRHLSFS